MTSTVQAPPAAPETPEVQSQIASMVHRARVAQAEFESWGQEGVDEVVTAVAWAIYEPARARSLAERSVRDTGLGNVEDKFIKNRRKTLGTLRDLIGAPSVGVVAEQPELGITEYAKPIGVVAAVCPSTNPAATPANKTMMIVKGRNAVILSPSPKGASTCAELVGHIHAELDKIGAPRDLVQFIDRPSKALTYELMRQCDKSVVTGSQKNVNAAYSSGKPAIGVGVGNAPVIVDSSADLGDVARKVRLSKTFDYATSCSSENSLHVHAAVYTKTLDALTEQGAYVLSAAEKDKLQRAMWPDGHLSQKITAQSPARIAEVAELDDPRAKQASFFVVEEKGVGPQFPFSGEKLSVVLTVYRFEDFDDGLDRIQRLLDHQGAGHSCGIHTADVQRARQVATRLKVARVLVNQAHCMGTGGGFDNGLGFTLTMGAGSWAGNNSTDNLSYRDFLNITRLARVIPVRTPSEEDLFGGYVTRNGR